MKYFNLKKDDRGIATLTFDTPDTTVNVLCFEALYELKSLLNEIQTQKDIRALFIESAKEDIFIAGADIKEIKAFKDESIVKEMLSKGQEIFNLLESLPFITVAVIDGACLGGGLELALACDYRLATNDAHTRIGLVEVSLGIIPGLGGTQRLVPLVGFAKAIELITASKRLKGDKALKLGVVDASVPSGYLEFKKEEFVKDILSGMLDHKIQQRRKGVKWYEKFLVVRTFIAKMARRQIEKKTGGHYPAPLMAVDVLEESFDKTLDEGLQIEIREFLTLSTGKISKNLIELFFTSEKLKKETFSKAKARTIRNAAVIGVGTMGSGIAWVLSAKDIPVRLKARKMNSIAKAMAKMMKNFEAIKRRGRLTDREIGLKMDKVTYTIGVEGLSNIDIAIEAVSEESAVKHQVFEELEAVLGKDAIIATNTSSLAITSLTKACKYPGRFVGMHFFNPVAKMPLVEIIAGKETNEETVATVVQLAKRLGKTPIKVGECAGFLVNRILLPYLNESAKMFEEGESVERIDALLKAFGMPMGPFTLADEVGIDIGEKVSVILHEAYGERMKPSPLLEQMSAKAWLGKKTGTGFYTHKGRRKRLNSQLELLRSKKVELQKDIILDRAILIMVNEAARCLEEGVVDNAHYLDMAMVMGTGFPAFRGGLLRYADSEGTGKVVARLRTLEERFGERFAPAALLVEMAESNQTFYGGM